MKAKETREGFNSVSAILEVHEADIAWLRAFKDGNGRIGIRVWQERVENRLKKIEDRNRLIGWAVGSILIALAIAFFRNQLGI